MHTLVPLPEVWPSVPASGDSPWSFVMRSARKASSAQNCSRISTFRSIAAAPTTNTAAPVSLSSVPEHSTRERLSGPSVFTIDLLRSS